MKRDLVTSALAIVVLTVLLGVLYPLLMTGIGQARRQMRGIPWAATRTRASHSGCSWARYGSSETTFTAASATARTRSWSRSWRRCGSAATRAASPCGNPAIRAASLVTTRWYCLGRRLRIARPDEPAAQPNGGTPGAGRRRIRA